MDVLTVFLVFISSCLLSARGKYLLVAHNNDILKLEFKQKSHYNVSVSPVLRADQNIVAFDVHPVWRQVYWSTGQNILRSPLYDSSTTTLIAVVGYLGSIAVDWVHNHVYWTDLNALESPRSRIEAAHTDGSKRRILYEADWPTGELVLDPQFGKLFWIESGQVGRRMKRVKSINLDGTDTKTLLTHPDIVSNNSMTVSWLYKGIYFTVVNKDYGEVWKIFYPDESVFSLLDLRSIPTSMEYTRDGFFLSNSEGLFSVRWTRTSSALVMGDRVLIANVTRPKFHLLDPQLANVSQIRGLDVYKRQDVCDGYHGCEHECVSMNQTVRCICDYGYTLFKDNKTCEEKGYIFYSTERTFGRITLDGEDHTVLYSVRSAQIHSIDVHVEYGQIYWSDLENHAIYRAPLETPHKKQMVVSDVAAYGVTVDWIHDHLYWSDHSRIMVATLEGRQPVVLLDGLDAPAEMAVDPVNKYIFWAECGYGLSIWRAGLDGSDNTTIASNVNCAISLTVDPDTSTLYWLEWTGSVFSSSYSGSRVVHIYRDLVQTMTILEQQMLWIPLDDTEIRTTATNDTLFHSRFHLKPLDIQLKGLKVIKSSQQPSVPDICEDSDCTGLCVPAVNGTVPLCVCDEFICSNPDDVTDVSEGTERQEYLRFVNSTPYSVTLECSGSLLAHPVLQPYLTITEVASLVNRDNATKLSMTVRVSNKSLPFTIDTLNPATTYNVSVRSRVTRASYVLTVHTPPPPLAVKRLTVVSVPGMASPVKWKGQGVHYFSPNAWEDLVHKDLYLLLLFNNSRYNLAPPPSIPQTVLQMMKRQITQNFHVKHHYGTQEEFDDDPEIYLGHTPWGQDYSLAMVQITQYRGSYNLDIVYSEVFSLPDPGWSALKELIFELM